MVTGVVRTRHVELECTRDQDLLLVTPGEVTKAQPMAKTLLALNSAHAQESWLEPERLRHLVAQGFLARRIGNIDAFLLAFDQDADYDSPNFLWFRVRYPRFVYVVRIVVAESARGRGCAQKLYQDLFKQAEKAGHDRVVCEINSRPPNPASDGLPRWGLRSLGTANANIHGRRQCYLSRPLPYAALAGGSASTE